MKMENRWKKASAVLLAAAAFGSVGILPNAGLVTAYAAGSETPLGVYTEEELAMFQDNVLEYGEIRGLIEHYNPSYLNQLEVFYGNPDGESGLSRDQLLLMANDFRAEANALKDEMEELEETLSEEIREEYEDNIRTLKQYAKDMEKSAKGTASTRGTLQRTCNRLVVEMSGKYRAYRTLAGKDELQKKSLELAELTYEAAKRQKELGMYSMEQLLASEDSRNAARTSMDTSTVELQKSRQELIMAFGWPHNGNPEILPVPEPDTAKIDTYNLEADTELAVMANYDVADLRKKDKKEFNSVRDKLRQIEEKENQVRMQMEFLSKDVSQKLLSYHASLDGLAIAEITFAQVNRKYQLGMLSRLEYLAEEINWLTAKNTKEQAAMDLTAAMETYEWAIKGLMTL